MQSKNKVLDTNLVEEENLDWRYEIKYVLRQEEWWQLQQVLVQHPASFRTAFPDRVINNVYLDTSEFSTCMDNLSGISDRRKYRVRWYGVANEIVDPVLEVKIKNNALGRKEIYPITTWNNNNFENDYLSMNRNLSPVLQNQYLRSYFIDWKGDFRLTVDRQIKYKPVHNLSQDFSNAFSDEHIVVELKFKEAELANHQEISRYLPFRPSKHSKYVSGVFWCYG